MFKNYFFAVEFKSVESSLSPADREEMRETGRMLFEKAVQGCLREEQRMAEYEENKEQRLTTTEISLIRPSHILE